MGNIQGNFQAFTTKAYIHSLNRGKMGSTEQDEVEIIDQLSATEYIARYKGVLCTAVFNGFTGSYYVDDVYGIIKLQME